MLARTAFGLYGSAQPGPSTTYAPASASRCGRSRRRCPDRRPRADMSAGRPPSRGLGGGRRRSPVFPSPATRPRPAAPAPRPRRRAARTRSAYPARLGGGDEILALGDEQPLAIAPLALRELADQLQLLVVLARDHCLFSVPENKKGASWGARWKVVMRRSAQAATASRAWLGESAERLRIAHGDIGEHLAVDLDAGLARGRG